MVNKGRSFNLSNTDKPLGHHHDISQKLLGVDMDGYKLIIFYSSHGICSNIHILTKLYALLSIEACGYNFLLSFMIEVIQDKQGRF